MSGLKNEIQKIVILYNKIKLARRHMKDVHHKIEVACTELDSEIILKQKGKADIYLHRANKRIERMKSNLSHILKRMTKEFNR